MRRFLLADDDEDDRNFFERAIHEIDPTASCYLAENGRDALTLLSNTKVSKPDIIFLDVNMPVMDGWECLKRIKENDEYRNVHVVIYSTTSQQTHVLKALQLGALCLFTKPDSFKRIKEILSQAITNSSADMLSRLKQFPEIKWRP